MKKLLLLMTIALVSLGFTSCETKTETAAQVEFYVATDYGNNETLTKLENLLKSKDLPIGVVKVSAEGGKEELDIRVKQIVTDMLLKVTAEELKAINPNGTYLRYSARYVGSSSPIVSSIKEY